MAGIGFHKLECCGNDFVIVPGLTERRLEELRTACCTVRFPICDRRYGVGADGLFLISHDGQVVHRNSDGSQSFCGTGCICVCYLSRNLADMLASFKLNEIDINCLQSGTASAIRFRPDMLTVEDVELEGTRGRYVYLGNPHLFINSDLPDPGPNRELAVQLRNHPHFPEGANVSFWKQMGEHVQIITYERGVEDFTLACGSACAAFMAGFLDAGTAVFRTLSGSELAVTSEPATGTLTVQGEVHHVFEGHYLLP